MKEIALFYKNGYLVSIFSGDKVLFVFILEFLMNDFSHSQILAQGKQSPDITKTSGLAAHLNIPVRTVQRYLSRHARHVGATQMGKRGWVLGADSLRLLEEVRDLYRSGSSQAEVEFSLTKPSSLSVYAMDAPSDLDELTASLEEVVSEVDDFRVIIDDLQTENFNLRYEVDELKSALEEAEQERYEQKTETELLSEQVDRLEEMLTELLENEVSR